mmetsp:Transcript_30047/g.67783  ORF Transcript_30047/g.67783 Transcript_30047/m.67783 type:complete len:618 (+) Transcript_30047:93-1946(+)
MNVAMVPMDPTEKLRPPLIAREFSTGSCLSSRSIISNASASSTRTHRRLRLEIGSTFFAQTPENRCPTVAIASYSGGTRVQSFDTLETRSSCDGKSTTRLLSSSPDSLEREHACDESSTLRHSVRAAELKRESSFGRTLMSREPERRPCSPSLDEYKVASNASWCPPAHVDVGREERVSDEADEPPLPPKIKRLGTPPPASVRNRSRSTSISDMSQSFFEDCAISKVESAFSSGSSPSTTRDTVLCTPAPVERINSLVTIDSGSMIETMPTSLNRGQSSTMMSCASTHSYVSSTNSSSSRDDLSCCTSEGKTSEQDELLLALSDFALEGAGRSSVHDNYYHGESEETVQPRLTPEVLKMWDELQDGQEGEECFISRALSCASRLDGSSHNCSPSSFECSESGPHLMASPYRALSHQSFELSYTNTGRSSGPPSTITSIESRRSDLDFDVTFIYSYSQDKTRDDVELDYSGHALRPKGHRRIRSTGSGVGFRISSQPKTYPWDRPCRRRHRRIKSEGNINKSLTSALPHDLSFVGNSTGVNDSPNKIVRHRRELSPEGTVENAASLASRKSHPTVTIRSLYEGSQRPDFFNGTFSLHSLLVGFLVGMAVGMSMSASLK